MITVARKGAIYALLAYGAWGLLPIYWKCFAGVPSFEVIAHRLVWSFLFLSLLVLASGQGKACLRIFRAPRLLGTLGLTSILLSSNWVLFVYGVNTAQVVETSLGYFINPLVNVLLGCVVLGERLRRVQVFAVLLATAGVVAFGLHVAQVPWIALGLAVTFGLYGLFRKMVSVEALPGLLIETMLMAPVALIFLGELTARHVAHFHDSAAVAILLVSAGVITVFPLLWFISAARLMPLSTLGFFQYVAPTIQLCCGVFLYHESFTERDALAFGLIWIAIAIYLTSAWRGRSVPMMPE